MGETLICDLESNGLLDTVSTVHMLQIGSADGTDAVVYTDKWPGCRPLSEGVERIRAADVTIWHGGINYDRWVMRQFLPGVLNEDAMLDTLVLARLSDPEERNHSLKAWGQRLELLKGDFNGPWDTVTQEMVDYAARDVVVGRALWHRTKHVLDWGESAALEHRVAIAINAQERNGFTLDLPKVISLESDLRQEIAGLDAELAAIFPPIPREQTWVPKASNSKLGYKKGEPHTKKWLEVFAPSSRQQIGKRLMAAGWKPRVFGKDSVPTVDEGTLAKLNHPGAKLLVKRFRAEKLLGQISDGKNGWLKLVKPTGRVHGRVNSNGACTGRMSHSAPNVAQVSKDHRARECWIPKPGWKLVGVDAEGLEARLLAHYLHRYDGGAFTKMLLEGRKEDATDVHSANAKAVNAVGFPVDREGAKTLLYALMYGAGDPKLGMTVLDRLRALGLPKPRLPPRELGALVRMALSRSMKGIDRLTSDILQAIKTKKHLRGLDGRHVVVRSTHSALNTLLQGAGAIVMKRALADFFDKHQSADYGLCAAVHDEQQLEAHPDIAAALGQSFADCIRLAGEHFSLKCPLAGKAAVGDNWSETH